MRPFAQRPTSLLAMVVTREECYIKSEKSNSEKKVFHVKKCVPNFEGSQCSRKNKYTSHVRDETTFK